MFEGTEIIKCRSVLNSITPDFDGLLQITEAIGCNGYYVFTMDSSDPGTFVSGRMFAPAIGINEDPVTGNANGPAGVYLYHHGVLKSDTGNGLVLYRALQGEAMGKPGIVEVSLHIKNGVLAKVQVAGSGVVVPLLWRTELSPIGCTGSRQRR